MNHILVVEDEGAVAHLIRMSLTNAGYHCDVAYDGEEGANQMQAGHYDLCLLDIMLPKVDGYELLDYAKSMEIPVIFLTAKGKTQDKVKGLRAGADDYITKPFGVWILDLHIDIVSRTVTKRGRPLHLTYKEFDLLLLFLRNPDVALYREVIYEHVWESSYMGDSRTVDLHVQRLRKKAGLEKQIEAVYKVGYRFSPQIGD